MISIIVPVYNVEKYLPQCLDSLIGQTYRDLEIICVNDGSTDRSQEILELYAEKDERIRVFRQENQGPSEARNLGIEQARGAWLMFSDSDDWWEPDCCEKVKTVAEDYDLVFYSYTREFKSAPAPKRFFGQQPRAFEAEQAEWLFEQLIAPSGNGLRYPANLDSLSTVWGKLYKAQIIREQHIRLTSTSKTGSLEDLVFNVKYFNHVRNAYYLPDCLYHYRKTADTSIAYSHKPALDRRWLYAYHEIETSIDGRSHPWLGDALERRKALCLFGLGLNIVFSKKGWRQERRMLNDIVCSDWYSAAIAKLDTTPMPLHWKCFYRAARHQQTWIVLLMLKTINIIINR